MKKIDLDSGIEIVGFNKKEIKEILKTEKKFKIDMPGVFSRDLLKIKIKIKKKKLVLTVNCEGVDADENKNFECKNSIKDLEKTLYHILTYEYN